MCSICLNENKKYRNLTCSCGHTFHKKCINRWLKDNNTCPLCKRVIKEEVDKYGFAAFTEQLRARYMNGPHHETDEVPAWYDDEPYMWFDMTTMAAVPPPMPRIIPVDADVDDGDVAIVMSQTGCSEEEAINALITNDGDIVNAIYDLSFD